MRRTKVKTPPAPLTLAWPALVKAAGTASYFRPVLEQVWVEEHEGGRLYLSTNSYILLAIWDGGVRPPLEQEPQSAFGVRLNAMTRRCVPTGITAVDNGLAVIDDNSGTKLTVESPPEFTNWRALFANVQFDRENTLGALGVHTLPTLLQVAKHICDKDKGAMVFSPSAAKIGPIEVSFLYAKLPTFALVMPVRET